MAKVGAFRFWCQKVLPLVYDDSISYYELLNKMVVYLNNVISDFNTVAENFDNLDDAFDTLQGSFNDTKNAMLHAYDQLQSYVNSYFGNLDVQEEINKKLDEMAEDGSLTALLQPFIENQISADVAAWLQAHITPTSPAVDSSLTVSGAAADAKVTGDKIGDLKADLNDLSDGFVKRTYAVKRTVIDEKRWDYYNNFAEKTLTGYYACSFNCEEDTEYKIQARNIGTNTTFAIGFIDGQGNVLSSISNLPSNPDHYAIVRTPQNCVLVKFTTNNQTNPVIKIETTKYEVPLDEEIVYVATNGSDTGYDGSKEKPFQTIQKAINSCLSDTIVIAAGRYTSGFNAENRKKLHIIGDVDGGTIIDYSVTVSPTTGDSGVQEFTFASVATDPIYKVFVSQELPLSQRGNATAYTINLWTYDGTTLMIPKTTLEEVQATPGTWTYDGSKIYINGNSAHYKLVPTYEDIAVHLSGISDLVIENISIKYAGYTNCKIEGINNAVITKCDFSNAGRQHGLAIEDTNATVSKCTAFRNCYDGFNIHKKGNTTFIDCESGYNRDDGMSHHDGSTGTVIGGKYHHNTKGGISPTYDSVVNIYNALCASNGYGIYYSTVTNPTECTINDCVLLANNGYGLRVVGYNINSFGTIYSDNATNNKADGGGTIYEIAN